MSNTPSQSDSAAAPESVGDPAVEACFALGWHMVELINLSNDPPVHPEAPYLLPATANLAYEDRRQLFLMQVAGGAGKLDLDKPNAKTLSGQEPKHPAKKSATPSRTPDNIKELHEHYLVQLTAADYRKGKSYGVGVALAENVLLSYKVAATGADPDLRKRLQDLFLPARVARLRRDLSDLKSKYQPYAADAVWATLADWSEWLKVSVPIEDRDRPAPTGPEAEASDLKKAVTNNLYKQGQEWRALLSGEKKATDFLAVKDYISALQHLLTQYWRLARSTVGRLWGLVLVVVSLGLLFVAIGQFVQHQFPSAIGASAAFLGLFGLTGASVVAAVKNALNQTEDHLWKAELGGAVALAISEVPVLPTDSNVSRLVDIRPDLSDDVAAKASAYLASFYRSLFMGRISRK